MVLAKTKEMAVWLSKLLKEREIGKQYIGLISGKSKIKEGIIRYK